MLKVQESEHSKLRLRWRFEYVSKPAKYGGWDYTGDDEHLSAWRQSREGLLAAILEAKTPEGIILKMVDCPGSDFCNFQWEMEARMSGGHMAYRHVGLTLVSRTHRYTIYCNGQIEVKDRKQDDHDNHYEYGKV